MTWCAPLRVARELYSELARDRDKPITIASRVATDDEIRDKLRDAIEDLRSASGRLQGKKERTGGRASTLLITGIALGILFNPVTGPETRRFIKDMFSGGDGHGGHDHSHGDERPLAVIPLTPGTNGPAQRRRVEPVGGRDVARRRSAPPRAPGR